MLRVNVVTGALALCITICQSVPVQRNTLRGVLDEHLGNVTAANILADALFAALQGDNHHSLSSIPNYVADASSLQAVSVANEIAAEQHAEDLQAAAERLAKMEPKQKLVSIEIVKINPERNVAKKDPTVANRKVRKIRRRKLVHRGSLRTTTIDAVESVTPASNNFTTDSTKIINDSVISVTEVLPRDVDTFPTTTVAPLIPTTETVGILTTELPLTADEFTTAPPPLSEQTITPFKQADSPPTLAVTPKTVDEQTNNEGEYQKQFNSAASNEALIDSKAVISDNLLETSSPSHAKYNAESDQVTASTNEAATFITEAPYSSMDLKTVSVRRPSGAGEVQVLSNSRQLPEVNLAHVHLYPKVPFLTGPSQVALNIGGLRYMRIPRRIKFKVLKGDIQNVVAPGGYSLLKGEPTESASHDEFTFVRDETTLPATATTEPTTPTTEPTTVDNHLHKESSTINNHLHRTTTKSPTVDIDLQKVTTESITVDDDLQKVTTESPTVNDDLHQATTESTTVDNDLHKVTTRPTTVDDDLHQASTESTPKPIKVTTISTESYIDSTESTTPALEATTVVTEPTADRVNAHEERPTLIPSVTTSSDVSQEFNTTELPGKIITDISAIETTTDTANLLATTLGELPAASSTLDPSNLLEHLAQNETKLTAVGRALDQLAQKVDTEISGSNPQPNNEYYGEVKTNVRKPEEVTEGWVPMPTHPPVQPLLSTQAFETTPSSVRDAGTEENLSSDDVVTSSQLGFTTERNLAIESTGINHMSKLATTRNEQAEPNSAPLDLQTKTDHQTTKEERPDKELNSDITGIEGNSQNSDDLESLSQTNIDLGYVSSSVDTRDGVDLNNSTQSETIIHGENNDEEAPVRTNITPIEYPPETKISGQDSDTEIQTEYDLSTNPSPTETTAEAINNNSNRILNETGSGHAYDAVHTKQLPSLLEHVDVVSGNGSKNSAVETDQLGASEVTAANELPESDVGNVSQNEAPLQQSDVVKDRPLEVSNFDGQTQKDNPIDEGSVQVKKPLLSESAGTTVDAKANTYYDPSNIGENVQPKQLDAATDPQLDNAWPEQNPPTTHSAKQLDTDPTLLSAIPTGPSVTTISPIESTTFGDATFSEDDHSESTAVSGAEQTDANAESASVTEQTDLNDGTISSTEEQSRQGSPSTETIPTSKIDEPDTTRTLSDKNTNLATENSDRTGVPSFDESTKTTDKSTTFSAPTKYPKMRMLDQVNIPVLPFGGSRFAELDFEVEPNNGQMRMVINEIMAIVREEAMPPEEISEAAEDDKIPLVTPSAVSKSIVKDQTPPTSEAPKGDHKPTEPHPPILSQPKDVTSSKPFLNPAVVTDVTRSGGKILMPDAPTIIMQVPPPTTPVARFALRRIPGHINVPSVYEILDPEGRTRTPATGIDNVSGRAIVTLPLLPLRALPPIQQNYYRYNRIPPFSTPQIGQTGNFQQSGPQAPNLYPRQFQTTAYSPPAPGYERLFPQSYPTPQGNIFYINTAR